MSYRSDVKITMPEQTWKNIKTEIELNPEFYGEEWEWERNVVLNHCIERRGIRPGIILVSWNYVSWNYDTNEVVAYIVDELRKCGAPFKYIRVRRGSRTIRGC